MLLSRQTFGYNKLKPSSMLVHLLNSISIYSFLFGSLYLSAVIHLIANSFNGKCHATRIFSVLVNIEHTRPHKTTQDSIVECSSETIVSNDWFIFWNWNRSDSSILDCMGKIHGFRKKVDVCDVHHVLRIWAFICNGSDCVMPKGQSICWPDPKITEQRFDIYRLIL